MSLDSMGSSESVFRDSKINGVQSVTRVLMVLFVLVAWFAAWKVPRPEPSRERFALYTLKLSTLWAAACLAMLDPVLPITMSGNAKYGMGSPIATFTCVALAVLASLFELYCTCATPKAAPKADGA
ncbi:hypothetical protein LPJ61_004497 [Coemansia biformis]|uniref:Uncharacterized protein n=1 Tax=Coemansia biformis TaxID=1286918 RepID=A0A9W8CWP9_9FUNG|nr:hypothetical protein LPJ61_004497 [Coemansia biformis]